MFHDRVEWEEESQMLLGQGLSHGAEGQSIPKTANTSRGTGVSKKLRILFLNVIWLYGIYPKKPKVLSSKATKDTEKKFSPDSYLRWGNLDQYQFGGLEKELNS